jgi:23S rRNA (adenine2503-C2)-methyltransferase
MTTAASATRARTNLFGLERPALARALAPLTDRGFHADQIYHWMYGRGVTDVAAMSDLPATLRRAVAERFRIALPTVRAAGLSTDGSVKYVLTLDDGREIEAVHMVHGDRVTLCLSSQVGCPLDCAFCLTGTMGLVRNLTPGEMVAQVTTLAAAGGTPRAALRLVFMGMGEPLNNYEAVLAAFRILVDPRGFAIPPRRITLSTAGLVPGIARLAGEAVRPRLAISLAAPDDVLRSRLMPINRKWNLEALLGACRAFPLGPRERITFEYALILGVNDSPRQALALARRLRGVRAKVNVIPHNETGLGGYRTPSPEVAARFRDALLARGVPTSIRWSKGRDIGAACGQLVRGSAGASAPGATAGDGPDAS